MGVKGSYRSVSQGYDNVPDIEIGAGDAVDAHVQRQMRLGFIRKVYGILTCQLALTTIVCSALALNGACRRFVMTTPSLMYIGMFGSFGVLFALMAFKNQHPLNAQSVCVDIDGGVYRWGCLCVLYCCWARTDRRGGVGAHGGDLCFFDTVYRVLEAGLELHGSRVVVWFTPPHFL